MAALVIAEHDNNSVKGATLNTVTAALLCGGDVHVLIAGHNAGGAAAVAAQIAGVAKVLHADAAGLDHGLAENVAAQVVALAGAYSHILFPATAAGKNVAPRVAALLDVAQISDATKVISADTFERPIYAGNAIATVQSLDATKVITVRTTGFDAAAASGGSAAVESLSAVADSGSSAFMGSEIARNDRPELTAAKIIVSGGRALGSSEKFNSVVCAQRLAGRADRQDRGTPAVHRRWHQRCDPAPGRHERQQGHRRDQQGRRGADLQRGRLRPGGRLVHRRARADREALTAPPDKGAHRGALVPSGDPP
jgi:electron transfer flavoprotein alpha subunit